MRAILAAVALSMLMALPAHAQFTIGAGIEYFSWKEDTDPIQVEETGALLALNLGWTQARDQGVLFAYRGRAYFGDVDYEGALLFDPGVPVSGTTSYVGMSNEGQLRYRLPARRGYSVDLLGSVGFDYWERELNQFQQEDYSVAFVRLGFEINPVGNKGWMFGAGAKYPVWVSEDANLTDNGYDQNPKLEPGGSVSAFGQIGYRFQQHFAVIGYLDGYRFTESDPIFVTQNGTQYAFVQPASTMYVLGVKLQYQF